MLLSELFGDPLCCLAAPAYNEGIINFCFRGWETRMWTLYGCAICADDIYWFISSPHLSLTCCSNLGHSLLFPGIDSQCNFLPSIFSTICFGSYCALLRKNWWQLACICHPPGKSLWPSRTIADHIKREQASNRSCTLLWGSVGWRWTIQANLPVFQNLVHYKEDRGVALL